MDDLTIQELMDHISMYQYEIAELEAEIQRRLNNG
jgi:uncharacterized small protein (DUF1192 family)